MNKPEDTTIETPKADYHTIATVLKNDRIIQYTHPEVKDLESDLIRTTGCVYHTK